MPQPGWIIRNILKRNSVAVYFYQIKDVQAYFFLEIILKTY